MTVPSDERVYTMLSGCGGHASWATRRLHGPITSVHEAVLRHVQRRHPPAVNVAFEDRKHRALDGLASVEIVR